MVELKHNCTELSKVQLQIKKIGATKNPNNVTLKRDSVLRSIGHLEVQLGRLAKMCRDIRAEIQSLTVEN